MQIQFSKYQGTGNDFVMLDNLNGQYDALSIEQIQQICDRRFGVGGDGLIKINKAEGFDFEVDYYNSDGSKSFCGNGARCSVAFAETLGIPVENTTFLAIDGVHTARKSAELVFLDMLPVKNVSRDQEAFVLNTGSPHYVDFVPQIDQADIVETGKKVRYSANYTKEGINVNLVELKSPDAIRIATYERGVEDETFSCGTGATACALVIGEMNQRVGHQEIAVQVKGGNLRVAFDRNADGSFDRIQLIGPAEFVFKGEINL